MMSSQISSLISPISSTTTPSKYMPRTESALRSAPMKWMIAPFGRISWLMDALIAAPIGTSLETMRTNLGQALRVA